MRAQPQFFNLLAQVDGFRFMISRLVTSRNSNSARGIRYNNPNLHMLRKPKPLNLGKPGIQKRPGRPKQTEPRKANCDLKLKDLEDVPLVHQFSKSTGFLGCWDDKVWQISCTPSTAKSRVFFRLDRTNSCFFWRG